MRGMSHWGRRVAVMVGAIYIGAVLAFTLTPTSQTLEPNLVPLAGIRATFENAGTAFGISQLLGNLVLLLPFGALGRLTLPSARTSWVLLAGLAFSVLIELAQWQLVAGRMADIDDVWLNTLGCAIGAWMGGLLLR